MQEQGQDSLPDEEVVWQSNLQDRYQVRVIRTGLYRGLLTISEEATVLHQAQTSLRYDAIFGPFAEEIEAWRSTAIRFIDMHRRR